MAANRIEMSFGGLFNSLHISKTPQDKAWSMQNCSVDNGILEVSPRYTLFGRRPGDFGGDFGTGDIGWGFGYGKYSGNEQQSLSVINLPVTGGTVILKWRPASGDAYEDTTAIPYNVSASGLQDIFESMAFFSPGDIKVSGGPWPFDKIRVEFRGQYANRDVELILLKTNSLAGSGTLRRYTEIKGGTQEHYIVALQKATTGAGSGTVSIYTVNAVNGIFSLVASGLNAGPWYFEQYAQRIWALNTVDGLNFQTLGGTWNNSSTSVTAKPVAPVFKPTTDPGTSSNAGIGLDFTFCTISGSASAFVTAPTIYGGEEGKLFMNCTSDVTGSVLVGFTVNLPGTGVNIQYNDPVELSIDCGISTSTLLAHFGAFNESLAVSAYVHATSAWLTPLHYDTGSNSTSSDGYHFTVKRKFHWASDYRNERRSISKFNLQFLVSNITKNKPIIIRLKVGDNWMNDDYSINLATGPEANFIRYAYSFYNASTDIESDLSEAAKTSRFPIANKWQGNIGLVLMRGSAALSSTDKLYVYRQEKNTGKWRRLANADSSYGIANPGSGYTYFYDHNMEHELDRLPVYGGFSFFGTDSGYQVEALGTFKQCLVIGSSKQAFISYVGQPSNFVDSPDNLDAALPPDTNLSRGRTDYVSDTRSEEVHGIHGQDSLYIVTPYGAYAFVGDIPADLSPPRRLPGSRGTLGKRSSYRLGGGVLSAAEDGLFYYSVGRGFSGEDNGALTSREETQDVRTSYFETLLSSTTSASNVVVTESQDATWVFNGNKYLCQTRNGNWIEGTFTHQVKATLPNRTRGLKFMDQEGKLYTIDSSYTTDSGSAVTWSYTTGILDGPRSRVRQIEIRGSGRPKVRVIVYDGKTATQDKIFQVTRPGQNYLIPINLAPGFRYQFVFSGNSDESIEYAALHVDQAGPALGN